MYCSNSVSAANRASAMMQYVEARRKAAQRRSGKRPLSADETTAEDGKRRKHQDDPKTSEDARCSRMDSFRSATAVAENVRTAAGRVGKSADSKKSVCDRSAGNVLSAEIKMVGRKATFAWWPVKSGPETAADIKLYELFVCKVDRKKIVNTHKWKVKAGVETLKHPVEFQFRFTRGFAYYCIVRAVDVHNKRGRFAFKCVMVR